MDKISKSKRSEVMRSIVRKNAKPEVQVRSMLQRLGSRFRRDGKGLAGSPEIVFRGRRKMNILNGEFWHQHRGCPSARNPKSNLTYWLPALEGSQRGDRRVRSQLHRRGSPSMAIWECERKVQQKLRRRLSNYLN